MVLGATPASPVSAVQDKGNSNTEAGKQTEESSWSQRARRSATASNSTQRMSVQRDGCSLEKLLNAKWTCLVYAKCIFLIQRSFIAFSYLQPLMRVPPGGTLQSEVEVPDPYNSVPPRVKCLTRIRHLGHREQPAGSEFTERTVHGTGWAPKRTLQDIVWELSSFEC